MIIHCFSDYYDESYGIRGHDCRVHDDMTRIAPDVPARPFPVVVLHPIKHGTTKFLLLFTRWLSITLFFTGAKYHLLVHDKIKHEFATKFTDRK